MSLNRGKESIALDLGADRGPRDLRRSSSRAPTCWSRTSGPACSRSSARLAEAARAPAAPGPARRSPASARRAPTRQRPAFDMVVQAMGGVMSLTGHPGGPPTRVGTSIGDIAAGLFGAIGMLAALHERERDRPRALDRRGDARLHRSRSSRTRSRATRRPARCRGRSARATRRSRRSRRSRRARQADRDRGGPRRARSAALCDVLGAPELARRPALRDHPRPRAQRRRARRRAREAARRARRGRLARAPRAGRRAVRPAERRRGGARRSAGARATHDRVGRRPDRGPARDARHSRSSSTASSTSDVRPPAPELDARSREDPAPS